MMVPSHSIPAEGVLAGGGISINGSADKQFSFIAEKN